MSEDTPEIEYLIDEDLGQNGGHLLFRDLDELEAWIEEEQELWSWLDDKDVRIGQLANACQNTKNVIDQIAAHTKNAVRGNNPEGSLGNIRAYLDHYRQWNALHSSAPEAKFIELMHENVGSVEAAAGLAIRSNRPFDTNDFRQFRGAVAMAGFMNGVDPQTSVAVRRSLNEIAGKYSERYASDAKDADKLKDTLARLASDHETLRERGLSGIAHAVKSARNLAREQREEAAQLLKDLEEFYNIKLALGAPADYWRGKRLKHRLLAWLFFSLFMAYAGAIALVGYWVFPESELANLDFWRDASFGLFGLTLAAIGVVVALARVPLRLFMSQLHLGNDADERVAMVKTFLAFRQGGHADEQHMQIVLERLFVPASDGIVKDDFAPVTALDALQQVTKRR